MTTRKTLDWPDGVPRFVIRIADDRRFFVYDLLHERRCTRLMVDMASAQRAVYECEQRARRQP